jgi:hypothetical protein
MLFLRRHILTLALVFCTIFGLLPRAQSQAALLLEEPYGVFGTLNPTGHNALYFARICADTPVKLRRCEPGELGTVIARYQGIAGYDWVAMPLIPYLYSVDEVAEVPAHVDKPTVLALRNRYHEQHLGVLGEHVFAGDMLRGGWTQLVGVAYERRMYAFRFATTPEQDDAMIAELNDRKNRSNFNLFYSNCADFARVLLDQYFPGTFPRTIFPDLGMTTPRQIAYKLVKYSKKHPETDLSIYEIPHKSVAASLITTGYAVPIVLLNPYLAGGIFVDYLVRGRYPLIDRHAPVLAPDQLSVLASQSQPAPLPQAVAQTLPAGSVRGSTQAIPSAAAVPGAGLKLISAPNE